MLVVISIIAILSSMTYGGLMSVRQSAKRSQTQLVLDKVDTALRTFRSEMGFYPRGFYSAPPVQTESGGFDDGLVKVAAATGLPTPDNDTVWAPASTPTTWAIGNGLFYSLGTPMVAADKTLALNNANSMRTIELDRFYHIGSYGNVVCAGLDLPPLFNAANMTQTVTAAPAKDWAHYDATGPVSLGEREVKRIFDHFRVAPMLMSRQPTPYSGDYHVAGGLGYFASWINQLFPIYVSYARPRDAADAYLRGLRHGVAAGNYTYDSGTDASGVSLGETSASKTINVATLSDPWHDDYLGGQLDNYLKSDLDGDTKVDILDAYGQPLVYINEGLPAKKTINCRLAQLNGNAFISGTSPNQRGQSMYGKGCMLLYHPDPSSDLTSLIPLAGDTSGMITGYHAPPLYTPGYCYVTDRVNDRGVPVRADAMDISLIDYHCPSATSPPSPMIGGPHVWALHGIDMEECGDPYPIFGTAIPSRVAVQSVPTHKRGGVVYYCVSKDGSKLVEPWKDDNGDGEQGGSELYYDRVRNGAYDTNVAAYDIRLCAPMGEERDFELLSAGRDSLFHAVRTNAANTDNLRPQVTRKH